MKSDGETPMGSRHFAVVAHGSRRQEGASPAPGPATAPIVAGTSQIPVAMARSQADACKAGLAAGQRVWQIAARSTSDATIVTDICICLSPRPLRISFECRRAGRPVRPRP